MMTATNRIISKHKLQLTFGFIVLNFVLLITYQLNTMSVVKPILSTEFKVLGRVQGTYFNL